MAVKTTGDPSALRPKTLLNRRYVVKRSVGSGWEGVTYLVRDRLDDREKALKLITNERREKAILSQARLLVRLQHPNIIDYYTVDRLELGGRSYFFLLQEYLHGPRLSEMVQRHFRHYNTPFLFQALRIFYQICRGMAYVHDKRILHDDLHTDNIILTGPPERPVPKLFDFWGSRGASATLKRAFDLRCAGQVFFEMMTGREDYDPAQLDWLPQAVGAIIRRTHARVHNYRSFHEIIDDLEQLRDWDD